MLTHTSLLSTSLLLAACSDQPQPQPVQGRVTVHNQPATGAFVVFHPESGEGAMQSLRPNGRVLSDGSFELTTYEFGDGAPAGRYRVTVEWPESGLYIGSNSEEAASGPDRLAGAYSDPASGFEVEIVDGNNELPPFDVTSAGRR